MLATVISAAKALTTSGKKITSGKTIMFLACNTNNKVSQVFKGVLPC